MYSVKIINDKQKWDNFINSSPQNNIFFKSFFLETFKKIERKMIFKGSEPKASIVLITNKKNIIENDIVIHSGIIFSKEFISNAASTSLEKYRITEFYVNYLTKNYNKILFNTAPGIDDIRPFLWFNYGKKKNIFKVYPKYTLFLNIESFNSNLEKNEVFKKMSTLRRRLVREGLKNKNEFYLSNNINYLVKNYKIYMKKQKANILPKKIMEMKSLLQNLSDKNKLLIQISNNKDGSAGYILAFAFDGSKSYYLYGCPLSSNVDNYLGTLSFWNMFKNLHDKNINEIDFEGVNSPSRGLFKQSFGGNMKQYFEIQLRK